MSLISRQQEVSSLPDDGTTFENITRETLTLRNQVQDMQHNPPQGPPRPGISRDTPFANYCRSDTQN
jgi:hypothetical protein